MRESFERRASRGRSLISGGVEMSTYPSFVLALFPPADVAQLRPRPRLVAHKVPTLRQLVPLQHINQQPVQSHQRTTVAVLSPHRTDLHSREVAAEEGAPERKVGQEAMGGVEMGRVSSQVGQSK